MISKVTSILAAGAAALVLVAAPAQALTEKQEKANYAAVKKQLQNLPKHKGPFGKIQNLMNQLAKLKPTAAAADLNIALTKISITSAKANATKLTNAVIKIVNKDKKLKTNQKKNLANKCKTLLKKYVPPGPSNPPYQAMVLWMDAVAV